MTEQTLSQTYDLIIVGGGIVGTTLAVALKATNLKICIIEAQSLTQATKKTQAYALSILSGKIFENLGVWEQILPHIGKFKNIRLSDDFFPHVVKFNHQELDTEYLGYVGEHKYILSALQQVTQNYPQITWLEKATVTDIETENDYTSLKVSQQNQDIILKTKLLVGADGSKSYVRQQAGIKTRGWKYWQSCVAFTVEHEANPNDTAFEKFWETGPMGILPLPHNRCQIVWSAPHDVAQQLKNLPEAEFISQLEHRTEGLLGKLQLKGDRNIFPVQLMQCQSYVHPRLALIGDAAHCCHPVGGQGLNLGIRDAVALAEIITKANQEKKDIGQISVLKQYERWRKKENLAILGFTDFLDRFFSNKFFPIVLTRRLGLIVMMQVKPLKMFALKLMTGLKGRKPKFLSI